MNLLLDPWIPIRARSGAHRMIRIAELLPSSGIDAPFDDPIDFASPRADFDAALAQFLVGVFDLVFELRREEDWASWCREPPTREDLHQALERWADAFELFDERRPFMQDPSAVGEFRSPASLLLEFPGDNALANNSDIFVKRRLSFPLAPEMAALTLLTLQINAPSGGRGFRTSVRGGGPLTTLLWPEVPSPCLFRRLWLNVPTHESDATSAPEAVLPWLAPVLESSDGLDVLTKLRLRLGRKVSCDEERLLCYFAMPRRVLLKREPAEGRRCAMTGIAPETLVTGYVAQAYGQNLSSHLFRHPFSPYYFESKGQQWLPQHVPEAGFSYRDWPALASGCDDEQGRVASCIAAAQGERTAVLRSLSDPSSNVLEVPVWASAYSMDNMKVLAWHSVRLPLFPGLPEAHRRLVRAYAEQLVACSEAAAFELRRALKRAWTAEGKDGNTSVAERELMAATEAAFYAQIRWAAEQPRSDVEDLEQRKDWVKRVGWAVLQTFERHGERAVEDVGALQALKRAAEAHAGLRKHLRSALEKAIGIAQVATRPSRKKKEAKA